MASALGRGCSTPGQARTANSGSKLPHSTWQRGDRRYRSTAKVYSVATESTLSNQRLQDLCEGVADFLDVRDDRDVVIFEPGDIAFAVDDSDGASGDALIGKIDAKLVGYGAARLEVREQRIADAHFFGEGFVGP